MESNEVKKDNGSVSEKEILWTKLSHTNSFNEDSQQVFNINRNELLAIKSDNNYYVVSNRCSHAGLPLKGCTIDSQEQTLTCVWHHSSFCYKTGEVKEWLKVSTFERILGKLFLKGNKQAEGMMDMEPIPVDTFMTKVEDDHLWVGFDN